MGGGDPLVQAPEAPEQRDGPRVSGIAGQARCGRDLRSAGCLHRSGLHGPVQPGDGSDDLPRAADRRIQMDVVTTLVESGASHWYAIAAMMISAAATPSHVRLRIRFSGSMPGNASIRAPNEHGGRDVG